MSWSLFPSRTGKRVELVARMEGPVKAALLKAVRELSQAPSSQSPARVVEALHSEEGLSLGEYPLYRANEICEQLSSLGILLKRIEHEV